jgi:DNA-binding CsgD family transcriptional regulator
MRRTRPKFTERQLQILNMMKEDLTRQEVADILGISPITVSITLQLIYNKFGVNNLKAAVIKAIRMRYISLRKMSDLEE